MEDNSRPDPYRVQYGVPTVVAVTTAGREEDAQRRGLGALCPPARRDQHQSRIQEGTAGTCPSPSRRASAAPINPRSPTARTASIRTYRSLTARSISCSTGPGPISAASRRAAFDATVDFYARKMAAIGWRKLTPETAASWPNADLNETVPERRARLLRPSRWQLDAVLQAEAGDADADAPRRRPHQCRDQDRAVRAAHRSRGRSDMAGLPQPKPYKSAIGPGQRTNRHARDVGRRACRSARRARFLPSRACRARLAGRRQRAARRPATRSRSNSPRPRKPACCGLAANMISPWSI